MKATRLIAVLAALAVSGTVFAQDNNNQETIDDSGIAPQALDTALEEFAERSGLQVIYLADVAKGKTSPGAEPDLSDQATLNQLLASTDLEYEFLNDKTVTLQATDERGASDSKNLSPTPVLMAQNQTPTRAETSSPPQSTTSVVEDEEEILEQIIVTGSRIRGAQNASPVVTITREEIDMAGFATVEEVIENLPQNFGAGASSDANNGTNQFQTVGGNVDNRAGGVSVNLRGLGASSTLVLIDGRRLSPSGLSSRFTSVSSIPVSAIERIEVMTDGASAIYGSDAIGGVVNFILRKEYDGAETRLRYGGDAAGSTSSVQIGQSFGNSWDGGNVLFTYEYYESDALPAADRDFTASNDLSVFGGTDRRQPGGNPANIRTGPSSARVWYAIPENQDGTSLSAADFVGSESPQRFFNERLNIDNTSAQENHSAFLHLRQTVGSVELFGAARFSREENERRFAQPVVDFNVPGDDPATPDVVEGNPFFVDPTGTGLTTVRVDNYDVFDDFGPQVSLGEIETSGATLGAQLSFGDSWQAELVGNWSKEDASRWFLNRVDTVALRNAATLTDPNLAFNPFGDGSNTNPTVIESLVDRRQFRQSSENELWSVGLGIDGGLFDVGGGTAKVAMGLDFREESLFTTSAVTGLDTDYDRNILAAYGELFVPLVSSNNSRAFLQKLEFSLAVRYEDYSDFGDTVNPKFGFLWSPVSSLAFRGTIGTSFRAPALVDLDDSNVSWSYVPAALTRLPDSVLYSGGKNSGLEAEEATTWTAGLQWRPDSVKGLSLDLTYFNVDFSGRIEPPTISVISAISSPRFASIRIVNPTPEQIATVVNDPRYDPEIFLSRGFGPFPAADLISGAISVDAIVDNRLTNLADSIVTGVDMQLSYQFDTSLGSFNVGFNGNYIFDFERRLLKTDPLVDEVDQFGRPVDFRARGNVGWSRDNWTVSGLINYTDGYTDNISDPVRAVDSWTTVDLTVAYNFGRDEGFLSNSRVALTTQNLFDEDPPFVDTEGGVGYDATNADPMGQFFALQLTKDW